MNSVAINVTTEIGLTFADEAQRLSNIHLTAAIYLGKIDTLGFWNRLSEPFGIESLVQMTESVYRGSLKGLI